MMTSLTRQEMKNNLEILGGCDIAIVLKVFSEEFTFYLVTTSFICSYFVRTEVYAQ
jgi:hypothetical protein